MESSATKDCDSTTPEGEITLASYLSALNLALEALAKALETLEFLGVTKSSLDKSILAGYKRFPLTPSKTLYTDSISLSDIGSKKHTSSLNNTKDLSNEYNEWDDGGMGEETKNSSGRENGDNGGERSHGTYGRRLSEDWWPLEKHQVYCESLGLNVEATIEDFKDYWLSKAGAGARKLDWGRTFRRWCRTAAEFSGNARRVGGMAGNQARDARVIQQAADYARRFGGAQKPSSEAGKPGPGGAGGDEGEGPVITLLDAG